MISPRPSNNSVNPRLETQDSSSSQHESSSTVPVEARRASLKKVPPPAPPRRDSMPKKKEDSSNEVDQVANEVGFGERSRTFSGIISLSRFLLLNEKFCIFLLNLFPVDWLVFK